MSFVIGVFIVLIVFGPIAVWESKRDERRKDK
jgi:uncharacterized Tic20 family protein